MYAQLLDLGRARRVEQARLRAVSQWETLRRFAAAKRRELVECSPGLQHWALVELLCAERVRAAADHAESALELARLALRVAELAPGEDAWRSRLQGYAWAFVANAERVGSDLVASEVSFATAWRLWRASGAAARGPLGAWRLHDLEASLRRAQRQFTAALACLERALAAAPIEARGRILLKKAYTLEQADQVEAALVTLEGAAPLVESAGEPRLRWVVDLNLILILARLGRYEEAEARLPALSELTLELGNRLDSPAWRAATRLGRARPTRGPPASGLPRENDAPGGPTSPDLPPTLTRSTPHFGFSGRGPRVAGSLRSPREASAALEGRPNIGRQRSTEEDTSTMTPHPCGDARARPHAGAAFGLEAGGF